MSSPSLATDKHPTEEAPPTLTEFEIESIDLFIRSVQVLGLPRSVGEIYGFLFAQAQPQPMDVLIRRLGMSLGSASQGLRFLKSIGAVRVTLFPGDRRDYFSAQTELRKLAVGLIKERLQPHLDSGDARIEQMARSAKKLPAGERTVLLDRIETLKAWRRKATKVLPVIAHFLGS